ncbi:MAG TPA: hypothetical protein VMT18_09590, partial [Planctomycetota bacterium]|nr:hypothetical protein [Planctomycetota bacterium]
MSSKKRVYDLAKEYGMAGQQMATKLKELGISEVKGPMSALDEFLLLRVEATLQANGIVPEAPAEEARQSSGGLTIRKKKKLKKVEPTTQVEEAPEEALAPEADEEGEPASEPEPVPAAASEPRAEPEAAAPEVPPAAAAPGREEVHLASEAPPAALEPEREPALSAEEVHVPSAAPPAAHAAAQDAPAPPRTVAETVEKPTIVRPASKRRAGKVVGFVDLTKVQTTPAPKRPESRRLRSKDDVTPDVRPTLGHDRKRALMRGDHASRGQLTAAQLRETEAGRFLRRRGMGAAAPRGQRGGRGPESSGSHFAGSTVSIQAPITIKKLADAIS